MRLSTQPLSFLAPPDHAIAQHVLADLDRCLADGWVLAGSLSYRPSLPRRERARHLHDIDIVLDPYKSSVPAHAMVRPSVAHHFFVNADRPMNAGRYLGLVHKGTRLWVDVYTAPHSVLSTRFALGSSHVDAQVPEETFFAIVKDLLVRTRDRRTVKPKWIANANLLWRHVDQSLVFRLMGRFEDEYRPLVPRGAAAGSIGRVINYALTVPTRTYKRSSRRSAHWSAS